MQRIDSFMANLSCKFEMRDLELLHYFLGFEVWQTPIKVLSIAWMVWDGYILAYFLTYGSQHKDFGTWCLATLWFFFVWTNGWISSLAYPYGNRLCLLCRVWALNSQISYFSFAGCFVVTEVCEWYSTLWQFVWWGSTLVRYSNSHWACTVDNNVWLLGIIFCLSGIAWSRKR